MDHRSRRPGHRNRYLAQHLDGSIKFRLSTLLLSIAVIAIATGWFFERQRLVHNYQIREEQLQTSSRVLSSAESHVMTASQFRHAPDKFDDAITKRMMTDVVNICAFRSEILETGGQPESAVRMTLSTLNCKTAAEFFALADRVQFNQTIGDLLLKFEIENQESRGALAAFVEKSLAEQN